MAGEERFALPEWCGLMSREDARRAHLTIKSDEELRTIAAMECVVPLDAEIAAMAADVLAEREPEGDR